MAVVAVVVAASAVFLLGDASVVYAAPDPGDEPNKIAAVVDKIRVWLFGILFAVASLFVTVGFMRLMWANGDPGEVEKGKASLRSAAIGYAGALLAPVIVEIVGGWVA